MNTDSFTPEQLLNLVNNTIIEKTDYNPNDFTGGAVQVTTSYRNKIITMKVVLMFGYDKNNNSRSFQCEINKDTYFLWSRAILEKTHSMLTKEFGADFNDLNRLMNSKIEKDSLDNKIEDRDRGSNIHSTNNSTNDSTNNSKDKPFSFNLTRLTAFENLSATYKQHLEDYIKEQNRALTFKDFVDGLESTGKKYKNFKSAYNTWANNKDKWDNENGAKTPKKQGGLKWA